MKNKISKKNAVIIAGAVVAVTAVGGTAYAMSGPKLALNKEKVTVEYGTQYKPKLKDIVKDYKDFDKKSLKLINKIPNEKDKTYPAVGKYTITVKYKKNSLKQSVIVKDTKAPEVAVPADIEILQGTDLATFDFKSLMNVSDAYGKDIDFKILITMMQRGNRPDYKKFVEEIRYLFPNRVYASTIGYQDAVVNRTSMKQEFLVNHDSNVGDDYRSLVKELEEENMKEAQ